MGLISYAKVRGVIVPFFFPCLHFREVDQITVMHVSLKLTNHISWLPNKYL